jgi:hypothetical protein
MKKVIGLVLFVFFCSCNQQNNDYVLSREEIIPVLVDLYIATEKVSMQRLSIDSSAMYMKSIYKPQVLSKHGVEVKRFDSSFVYYSSRPEDFQMIQSAIADSMRVKHLLGKIDY